MLNDPEWENVLKHFVFSGILYLIKHDPNLEKKSLSHIY